MAKISRDEYAEILRLADQEKMKVAKIAEQYECTPANIYAILSKLRNGTDAGAAGVEKSSGSKSPRKLLQSPEVIHPSQSDISEEKPDTAYSHNDAAEFEGIDTIAAAIDAELVSSQGFREEVAEASSAIEARGLDSFLSGIPAAEGQRSRLDIGGVELDALIQIASVDGAGAQEASVSGGGSGLLAHDVGQGEVPAPVAVVAQVPVDSVPKPATIVAVPLISPSAPRASAPPSPPGSPSGKPPKAAPSQPRGNSLKGSGSSDGRGAKGGKKGFALHVRQEDGEEGMMPFNSLDVLFAAIRPILRDAVRRPEATWFSIQSVDLSEIENDVA